MVTASYLDEFKTLFECCPDLFCIVSPMGHFLKVNPAWTQVLGYTQEYLLTRPFADFIHPDDIKATLDETRSLANEAHTTVCFENRYRKSDGNYIWLTWSARSKHGKIFAFAKDITKNKHNEILIAKTTLQLNDILQNSPGMVYQFQMDPDGKMFFPYVSSQTYEIYEITPEALKSNPDLMISMVHAEDQGDLSQKIALSAESLKPFEWTGRIMTPQSGIKWIKAKSIPRKLDSGAVLWNGIVVDITKEKELESGLLEQRRIAEHSARLASIGELAAGVGHEINNPLTIAMGNLLLLGREIDKFNITYPTILNAIQKINAASERIKKIVLGLGSLAHTHSDAEIKSSDLMESIQSTTDLVREIYAKEGVHLEVQAKDGIKMVKCSLTHAQQILMNLLSNAKDAAKDAPHPRVSISIKDSQTSWTLSVSDNGKGIAPEIKHKIFMAFFSTKRQGKGTGLGLAISKSIIESYGGRISFDTGPNGTTFQVVFPKINF